MDLSKALEGIERLLLEILGYLLPGFALLFLLVNLIDQPFKQFFIVFFHFNEWGLVAVAYVLGYIIYGSALVKDALVKSIVLNSINWIKKKIGKSEIKSLRTLLDDRILQSTEVEVTKSILKKLLANSIPNISESIDCMSLSSLRNLAMSYVPQSDRKIYTFMFRAELSNHTETITFVFGLWGFLGLCTSRFFNQNLLLSSQEPYIYWYATLILTSYFLAKTKARFLGIALSIPFSIFIAEYYSVKTSQKESKNE
jgi:hypothetical protein